MVMDQPSPQSVGREFVRQYYTMLHEAPQFLHRFYSHDSSFLHGGSDKAGDEQLPAVGQAEIFKKISSLNFHDCHAKIRQVDSQSSINGSVVIQVVGELSNNGMPLRRFMQTFVLAPQSPKKYYVHNDIFRYQDEVFSDATNELETPPDESFETDAVEDDETGIAETIVKSNLVDSMYDQGQQPIGLAEATSNGNSSLLDEHMKSPEEEEPTEQDVIENEVEDEVENSIELPAADHMEEPAEDLNEDNHNGLHENQDGKLSPEAPVADAAVPSMEEQEENGEKPVESDTEQTNVQSVPQKPTWAAMASKNMANSVSSSSNVGGSGMPGFATKPQATIRPEPKPENNTSTAGLPQRTPRSVRPEFNAGDNGRSGFDGSDEVGRGIQQYPDNQQVFVGNLPHYLADKELKEFFEKFGPVLDMRINRKANNNLPNFGFVVFDSTETVQKVLSARPLFNGKHRVNVEEKKPREELVASRDSRPRSSGNRIPSGKFSGPLGSGAGRGGDLTPAGRGSGHPGAPSSGAVAGSGRGYIRNSVSDEGKSPSQPNAR